MRKLFAMFAVLATLVLPGCGYNEFQTKDEQVKAAWAEVLNQYKRRADLIPNLVSTVQGYAAHEQNTLTACWQRRSPASARAVMSGGSRMPGSSPPSSLSARCTLTRPAPLTSRSFETRP